MLMFALQMREFLNENPQLAHRLVSDIVESMRAAEDLSAATELVRFPLFRQFPLRGVVLKGSGVAREASGAG